MDAGTLIAEVAKRDGILLDRNDPVIVVATAVDVAMEKRCLEMDAIVTRFEAAVASAKPALSDVQISKMTNDLGMHLMSGRELFSRASNLRSVTIAACALLAAMALGAGVVWFAAYDAGHEAGRAEGKQAAQSALISAPELSVKLTAYAATKWIALMDNNPDDPSESIRDCNVQPGGRTACSLILWINREGKPSPFALSTKPAGEPVIADGKPIRPHR